MYDFLDEFTDDSKIINEFFYYLYLPAWNQLDEFMWFTWLNEIIYSLITINLTEFIGYVNAIPVIPQAR